MKWRLGRRAHDKPTIQRQLMVSA